MLKAIFRPLVIFGKIRMGRCARVLPVHGSRSSREINIQNEKLSKGWSRSYRVIKAAFLCWNVSGREVTG